MANWIRICISIKPSGDVPVPMHSNRKSTVVQHDIIRYKWKQLKTKFLSPGLGGEWDRSYQRSVGGGRSRQSESKGVSRPMAPQNKPWSRLVHLFCVFNVKFVDSTHTKQISAWPASLNCVVVENFLLTLWSSVYSSVKQGNDTE